VENSLSLLRLRHLLTITEYVENSLSLHTNSHALLLLSKKNKK